MVTSSKTIMGCVLPCQPPKAEPRLWGPGRSCSTRSPLFVVHHDDALQATSGCRAGTGRLPLPRAMHSAAECGSARKKGPPFVAMDQLSEPKSTGVAGDPVRSFAAGKGLPAHPRRPRSAAGFGATTSDGPQAGRHWISGPAGVSAQTGESMLGGRSVPDALYRTSPVAAMGRSSRRTKQELKDSRPRSTNNRERGYLHSSRERPWGDLFSSPFFAPHGS